MKIKIVIKIFYEHVAIFNKQLNMVNKCLTGKHAAWVLYCHDYIIQIDWLI